MQIELMRKGASFLRTRQPVLIDGTAIRPELARINFLERTLRSSRVVEPPRELDVDSAILGVVFVYPTEGLPERVAMEWDLFNDRIQVVPASSVHKVGTPATFLQPGDTVLERRNSLQNGAPPALGGLRRPPSLPVRWLAFLRWCLLPGAVVVTIWLLMRSSQTGGTDAILTDRHRRSRAGNSEFRDR